MLFRGVQTWSRAELGAFCAPANLLVVAMVVWGSKLGCPHAVLNGTAIVFGATCVVFVPVCIECLEKKTTGHSDPEQLIMFTMSLHSLVTCPCWKEMHRMSIKQEQSSPLSCPNRDLPRWRKFEGSPLSLSQAELRCAKETHERWKGSDLCG